MHKADNIVTEPKRIKPVLIFDGMKFQGLSDDDAKDETLKSHSRLPYIAVLHT